MQRGLPLLGQVPATDEPPRHALLAKGFRPFFLLAALFAAAIVPLWILVLTGAVGWTSAFDRVTWHAHEMVFGFTTAVIAGFLLTAVGNWTQRETAVGGRLVFLCVLWIAGRVVMSAPVTPLIACVDLLFLPVLAWTVAVPIWKSRNTRNIVMPAVLVGLFAANVFVHLDRLGIAPGASRRALLVAVDIVTLLMVVVAARVLPMFTRNATGDAAVRSHPRADLMAAVAVASVTVVDLAAGSRLVVLVVCTFAAVLVTARAVHWGLRRTSGHPLLWILHLGHAWIAIGLALRAVATLDPMIPATLGLHAITAGAIGSLSFGMMARVALGHTGRPLRLPRMMPVAFVAMAAVPVLRVLGPVLAPSLYMPLLAATASAWTLAFAIYVVAYAQILLSPRVDAKPG